VCIRLSFDGFTPNLVVTYYSSSAFAWDIFGVCEYMCYQGANIYSRIVHRYSPHVAPGGQQLVTNNYTGLIHYPGYIFLGYNLVVYDLTLESERGGDYIIVSSVCPVLIKSID
jgi:hypothetical protein